MGAVLADMAVEREAVGAKSSSAIPARRWSPRHRGPPGIGRTLTGPRGDFQRRRRGGRSSDPDLVGRLTPLTFCEWTCEFVRKVAISVQPGACHVRLSVDQSPLESARKSQPSALVSDQSVAMRGHLPRERASIKRTRHGWRAAFQSFMLPAAGGPARHHGRGECEG